MAMLAAKASHLPLDPSHLAGSRGARKCIRVVAVNVMSRWEGQWCQRFRSLTNEMPSARLRRSQQASGAFSVGTSRHGLGEIPGRSQGREAIRILCRNVQSGALSAWECQRRSLVPKLGGGVEIGRSTHLHGKVDVRLFDRSNRRSNQGDKVQPVSSFPLLKCPAG